MKFKRPFKYFNMAMSTRCKTRSNLLYMYPLSLIYIKSFILILNFLHPWVLLFSLAFRWNKDYLTIICSEGHKNKNYSLFELILIINTAICECFANIKWKKELSHMCLLVAGLWFDLAAETSGSKEARKGIKSRSWCSWQLSLSTDIWR